MTAPFTYGACPACGADTKQRFLSPPLETDERELWTICESCFSVLAEHGGEWVVVREATPEERATVPPRVVWSEEQRARFREAFRESKTDLRNWFQAGCPGLTSEIESALLPGTMERLRRFVEQADVEQIGPEGPAEPGDSLDRDRSTRDS
jgi:hypothetical protein